MKDTIKLHEICGYLPYGIKAEMLDYKSDYVGKQYDEIIGVHQWDKNCLYWSALTVGGSKPNIERIKPILRPLSNLTQEIEHNGKRFVPSTELRLFIQADIDYVISSPTSCDYDTVKKLYEWHFDIHGLIDRNLALNLNDYEV